MRVDAAEIDPDVLHVATARREGVLERELFDRLEQCGRKERGCLRGGKD